MIDKELNKNYREKAKERSRDLEGMKNRGEVDPNDKIQQLINESGLGKPKKEISISQNDSNEEEIKLEDFDRENKIENNIEVSNMDNNKQILDLDDLEVSADDIKFDDDKVLNNENTSTGDTESIDFDIIDEMVDVDLESDEFIGELIGVGSNNNSISLQDLLKNDNSKNKESNNQKEIPKSEESHEETLDLSDLNDNEEIDDNIEQFKEDKKEEEKVDKFNEDIDISSLLYEEDSYNKPIIPKKNNELNVDNLTGTSEEKVESVLDTISNQVNDSMSDLDDISLNISDDEDYFGLEKALNQLKEKSSQEKPDLNYKALEDDKENEDKGDILSTKDLEEENSLNLNEEKPVEDEEKADMVEEAIIEEKCEEESIKEEISIKDIETIGSKYSDTIDNDEVVLKVPKNKLNELISSVKNMENDKILVQKDRDTNFIGDGITFDRKFEIEDRNLPEVEGSDLADYNILDDLAEINSNINNLSDSNNAKANKECKLTETLLDINEITGSINKDVRDFIKIRQELDDMFKTSWEIKLGKRFDFIPSKEVKSKLESIGLTVETVSNTDCIVYYDKMDSKYLNRRVDYLDFIEELKSAISMLSKNAMKQSVDILDKDGIPRITLEEIKIIKDTLTKLKLNIVDNKLIIDLNLDAWR